MKTFFKDIKYKYALWGMLFGCCFPIIASIITSFKISGTINWSTIFTAQANDPLLWIIDTAPLFLGAFAYFIGKEMDIIREKNKKIQLINQHLKAQEQIALVGKMTAGIAHDLRNPLNFISNFAEGSVELLEDIEVGIKTDYQHKKWLNYEEVIDLIKELKQNALDITESAQRANVIVLDLMNQTNRSKQAFQKIDLHQLVEDSIQLSLKNFKARHPLFKVEIEKKYHPDLAHIAANTNSLSRVLINLFNNSCDALWSKQATQVTKFTPAISIETELATEGVRLTLKDNGPGIPTHLKQKVFSPFFTTKPNGQGNTGLGLSICQDIIVNEHKGQLLVESEEGEYTAFHILLPL